MRYEVDVKEFRKMMIEKGFLSIVALSKSSGVSRETIGNILNKNKRPNSTTIEKLAIAMDLTSAEVERLFFAQKLA